MGKKWKNLAKRGIALALCVLCLMAMPVFAVGTEPPPEECTGEDWAVIPEETPEEIETPEEAAVPEEPEAPDEEEVQEEPEVPDEDEALEEPEAPEEEAPPEEVPEEPEIREEPEEPELPEEAESPEAPEPLDEDQDPENGVHIPSCGAGCTGADCPCPCHEEEEKAPELPLLQRLLSAESCQGLFALLQAEENAPEILALTAEELSEVVSHARALPDDGWQADVLEVLEMLLARLETEQEADAPQVYATATIHNVPQNAVVAYAYRTAGDTGWTWGGEYSGDFDITYSTGSGSDEEFFVFFVKPAENHLLTRFSIVNDASGGTSFDLYSIDCASSKISNYPDFAALVSQAKAMGYLGFNGYRSSAAGNVTLNQYFTGQKPALNLSATANPSENVKPGDRVTFTVVLRPETVADSTVRDFQLTGLNVNGTVYDQISLTANGDGSYTAVIDYTATAEDWTTGNITLNAEANITYEYILPVRDRDNNGSEITTTSTISNSGTALVSLASDYGVGYTLSFEPQDVEPPAKIPQAPVDAQRYFEGSEVFLKDYDGTTVEDPENGGSWHFDGWYWDTQGPYGTGDSLRMPKGGVLLRGTWRFEKYPTVTVTVRKLVTGNLGDRNREFLFRLTGSTYENAVESGETFFLKHGEEKTVTLNRGDTITLWEDCGDYVATSRVGTQETAGSQRTLTVTEDTEIVFYNRKEIPLDTGVTLDRGPYGLLLALSLAGGTLYLLGRRKRGTL